MEPYSPVEESFTGGPHNSGELQGNGGPSESAASSGNQFRSNLETFGSLKVCDSQELRWLNEAPKVKLTLKCVNAWAEKLVVNNNEIDVHLGVGAHHSPPTDDLTAEQPWSDGIGLLMKTQGCAWLAMAPSVSCGTGRIGARSTDGCAAR